MNKVEVAFRVEKKKDKAQIHNKNVEGPKIVHLQHTRFMITS